MQDSPINISGRMYFCDEDDIRNRDDEYVKKHQKHHIKKLSKDITCYKNVSSKIEFKYDIDGRSAEEAAEDLYHKIINEDHEKVITSLPIK